MSDLNIKPTHKSIKTYYAELEKHTQLGEATKALSVPHSKICKAASGKVSYPFT